MQGENHQIAHGKLGLGWHLPGRTQECMQPCMHEQLLESHHRCRGRDSLWTALQLAHEIQVGHRLNILSSQPPRAASVRGIPNERASSAIFSGPSCGCVVTEFDDIAIVSTPSTLISFASWTRASVKHYSDSATAHEDAAVEQLK